MLKIRDFRCDHCGYTSETMSGNSPSPQCHECGGPTRYIVSGTSFTLEGVSGDFPGASFKWEKKRDQKMELERAQGMTPYGQDDH